MKKIKRDPYAQAGVDYKNLDAAKKLAQKSSITTSKYLQELGFAEVSESRGESAFVWDQSDMYMASALECLGTKSLVADEMYKLTGKSYYDIIAQDTVATVINDLAASGAKPLALHAFWGLYNDEWLLDKKRTGDFIKGWKTACELSGVTWGGGETPSLTGVIQKGSVVLAASATGIIKPKSRLINCDDLKQNDRIILVKSNGVNANGISLARVVARKLKQGYATKMPSGQMYGEGILTQSNLYSKLIQNLLNGEINIHYVSNITGHGLRKIMRATKKLSYVVEKLFIPQEIFTFIQEKAELSDYDAYDTYNMGQDYAIFVPDKQVKKTQEIIKKTGFESIDAGYIEKGPRQVVIQPKKITYTAETLNLR